MKLINMILVFSIFASSLILVGCESEAQNKAAWGAVIGAAVGNAVGGDTEATAIGAAAGGGIGYVLGSNDDKKAAQSTSQSSDLVTVWIENDNGSKTPITLKKSGSGYVGPKGEYYNVLPTPMQLKEKYGL